MLWTSAHHETLPPHVCILLYPLHLHANVLYGWCHTIFLEVQQWSCIIFFTCENYWLYKSRW